ncbi:MAG: hypothetical protein AB7U98_13505 [Candidatus Nitrosocosmicus sp.]
MRLLIIASNPQELRALEAPIVVTPAVRMLARTIQSEHDVQALRGLHFDAIVGMDLIDPTLAAHITPLLRSEPYHV